jgi:hypothetical protein
VALSEDPDDRPTRGFAAHGRAHRRIEPSFNAIARRRFLGRTATLALLIVLPSLLIGCRTAFRESVETVAANVGRDADVVEAAFRRALPNASETELAQAADRTASETAWMKQFAARLAVGAEERATLRAIAGATCDLIGTVVDLQGAATEADIENVIRQHSRQQGLPETDAKVVEVADGILHQLDSLQQTGRLDVPSALLDLGCLSF